MNFKRMLPVMLAVLAMFTGTFAFAAPAMASEVYQGGWYTDNNVGGSEVLYLGDNSDNSFFHLSGTSGYCDQPGSSYARMRSIIGNEYDQISWWISNECHDDYGNTYARICVENSYGSSACSTYREVGWVYP